LWSLESTPFSGRLNQKMLLFIPLFHALFSLSKVAANPGHAVRISISADDEFQLFADNKTIGMGDHHDEVYKFFTDHGSELRIEAVDIHAESGLNPRSMRGIILSTSLGLVTNSNWRCIENNGSVLPETSLWPFAIELDNNDAYSDWGMRPEILPNASWIWAPRLSSGYYPSRVACVPSPTPASCVDNGCEEEFGGQGACVDFRTSSNVNFTSLATRFDLSAGSKSGLCGHQQEGKEECCHCMKKMPPAILDPTEKPYSNIIALGGDTVNGPTKVVEMLGKDNNTFHELPTARLGHSAFVHPGTKDVLVCGGKGRNHGTDTFRDCIAHNSNWAEHSTLIEPRMHASTVVMKSGDVYILGGEFSPDTSDVLRSGSKTWTRGPKLDHPTYMACATDINATSFVTIGGGVEENDVSLYNTQTGSWSKPWPKLTEGRRGHSCVRVHEHIIVAGGYLYGAHQNTRTTVLIDIYTGKAYASLWMNEARSFFTMHGFDTDKGIVVAVGGNVPRQEDDNAEGAVPTGFSNTIEVWNMSMSTSIGWTYEPDFKLSTGTGHFATVVFETN